MTKKVALITGASSGIGESAARELHRLGYTVYAGARRVDRMKDLRADGMRTLSLDVTPFGAWYHGTKFALEGMSDVLRGELKPFGIDVVVIEPGVTRTEWGGIASDSVLETSGHGPYAEGARKLAASFTSGPMHERASDPSVIAKAIATAVTTRRPKPRYAAGYSARAVLTARRLLSDRGFDRLMSRAMR
jgi:NAD(P)-dependent dehydrogenase (short-subunit alcohol dehydrogenase family)